MSEQAGTTPGLQAIGFPQTGRLHWNLSEPALYEEAIRRAEGVLTADEAAVLAAELAGR